MHSIHRVSAAQEKAKITELISTDLMISNASTEGPSHEDPGKQDENMHPVFHKHQTNLHPSLQQVTTTYKTKDTSLCASFTPPPLYPLPPPTPAANQNSLVAAGLTLTGHRGNAHSVYPITARNPIPAIR